MSKEILVTGGKGALATAIELEGHAEGRIIYAPTHAEFDVVSLDQCRQYLEGKRVGAIIHTAAIANWEQVHKEPLSASDTHILGSANMARLALEKPAFLVLVSTDAVLSGRPKDGGYNERDFPLGPTSMYGWTKWVAELTPKMVGLPSEQYIVARCGWFFGPNPEKDRKFVGAILRQIANGTTRLRAVNDRSGSLVYTAHIAQRLFSYVDQETSGIRHLANTGAVTRLDVAKKIVELWQATGVSVEGVSSDVFPSPVERPEYAVLATLFTDATMSPWQEALAEYRDRFPNLSDFR